MRNSRVQTLCWRADVQSCSKVWLPHRRMMSWWHVLLPGSAFHDFWTLSKTRVGVIWQTKPRPRSMPLAPVTRNMALGLFCGQCEWGHRKALFYWLLSRLHGLDVARGTNNEPRRMRGALALSMVSSVHLVTFLIKLERHAVWVYLRVQTLVYSARPNRHKPLQCAWFVISSSIQSLWSG